jgi:hypothetical protein
MVTVEKHSLIYTYGKWIKNWYTISDTSELFIHKLHMNDHWMFLYPLEI